MIALNTTPPRFARAFVPPFQEFCEGCLRLDGKAVRFTDRRYIPSIYSVLDRNVIIRSGRQVEKTTYLVFSMLYEITTNPGCRVLFICPRKDQAERFSKTRLLPVLEGSPTLRKFLDIAPRQRLNSKLLQFTNGSEIYIEAAFRSADAARGISATLLICDEFQDMAHGFLPVLQETLSHADNPRTIITGTPKLGTNHLETVFAMSTANAWTTTCVGCSRDVVAGVDCLGPTGLLCPTCHGPIDFGQGRWVATNPNGTWGAGFWIPQLIAPWIKYPKILANRAEYDNGKFLNEVIGCPTHRGSLAITREELVACCCDRPLAKTPRDLPRWAHGRIVAGIDWGNGGDDAVALVIGAGEPDTDAFHVFFWEVLPADPAGGTAIEKVTSWCDRLGVMAVGADARGGGVLSNHELHQHFGSRIPSNILGIEYGGSEGPVQSDGNIGKKTIDRTRWLASVFTRIKRKTLRFPMESDSETAFSHLLCEETEHDDEMRMIRFTHPDGTNDAMLHALAYAITAKLVFTPTRMPE